LFCSEGSQAVAFQFQVFVKEAKVLGANEGGVLVTGLCYKQTNPVAFSSQANYTDRATAPGGELSVDFWG
jgi:hypothetical protein